MTNNNGTNAIEEKKLAQGDRKGVDGIPNNINDERKSFFFADYIDDLKGKNFDDFTVYVFCLSGNAEFIIRDRKFTLKPLSCLVVLEYPMLKWLSTSPDFKMKALLISNAYLSANSPDTNYNFMGMLSLMEHPVVSMTKEQFDLCIAVGEAIKGRVHMHDHMFYSGVLRRAVETLVLDIYSLHSHKFPTIGGGRNQSVKIFRSFIQMIEQGYYRTNREVKWYAAKMNISPKYLSEVCLDVSGHSASYWINRFTVEEISRLLHNPSLSINTISDMLHFTTHSYFSHYVRDRMGMTPKDFRQRLLGLRK